MNNKKLPIIVGLVLLLLGLFAFAAYSMTQKTKDDMKNTMSDKTSMTDKKKTEQSMSEDISGSVFDLLKTGKSLSCTFNYDTDTMKSSGTTYISGNKMSGDFNTDVNGKSSVSHILSDGTYMYTWSEGMKQGMKVNIEEAKSKVSEEDMKKTSEAAMNDISTQYNYKCDPWNPDSSKFSVPSDVTFTDFSEMMKKVMPTSVTNGGNKNMCAACDAIEDTISKEKCKTSLGCR